MTAPKLPMEGLEQNVVYRDKRNDFYIIKPCSVCGKLKASRCKKDGTGYVPMCQACSSRTPEKRAIIGNLFRGRPKTPEQIEKLRKSSTGNKNSVGLHRSQETKEKLSKIFKGRKLSAEVIKHMSEAQKNRPPRTAEHAHNLSLSLKGRRPSDNTIKASVAYHTGRPQAPKQAEAVRQAALKNWADPEWRRKRVEEHKIRCNQPDFKEKSSRNSKARWADPEYKDRQARAAVIGANRKPNLKEIKLMDLINIACPNQYKYTGDGKVVIGGKIPDYTNTNGQKKVIEMFGDYFHSIKITGRTEDEEVQRRLSAFAEFGYTCLIIWERELKRQTPEQLVSLIQEFNDG